MQSLTRSAAFEKNRGNFYKGSELELGGLLLSSAAPPPTFGLFITLIQSGDTSDTAPCKNLSTGVSGIMEGSRGGGRNSSLIS